MNNVLDAEKDVIDVSGMTNEEIRLAVKRMDSRSYVMREHWYFGHHPLYKITGDYVLMQYRSKLYKSVKGQFHPAVKADLEENWRPLGLDESNWKRNNL